METGDLKSAAAPQIGDGDFYIEPDCCLLCGVPEDIAPEIFETGEHHCSVRRQPCSQHEIDRTIEAMWSSEVDCVRYRGHDPAMLERLARAGMAAQADHPIQLDGPVRLRNRVSFQMMAENGLVASASSAASMFRADMRKKGRKASRVIFARTTVRVAWYRNRFHVVRFTKGRDGRIVVSLKSRTALQGLSWLVDEWLRSRHASQILWEVHGDPTSASPTPM